MTLKRDRKTLSLPLLSSCLSNPKYIHLKHWCALWEEYLEAVQAYLHMEARLSALHLLCKAVQSCIAPMKKQQKAAQKKRYFWCFSQWLHRIWPVTKFLTPSVVMLPKAFKIMYLLKAEVFSAGRAQTCRDVKPFRKLYVFHLFRIVDHLRWWQDEQFQK